MKTFTISFVALCPLCQGSWSIEWNRLARSQDEWIQRMEKEGIYKSIRCKFCRNTVDAEIKGLSVQQEDGEK